MTLFNRLGNWLFTNAVRTVYRANVTDVLTGYFAWKKQTLDNLYPHLKSEGFAIEMEMVTKMARLGSHITSVPISYHPRAGESNLRPLQDGARILKMFIKNLAWKPLYKPATFVEARPRRIVFISDGIYPYMKGGKEKRLYEISRHLARMGYEVHIYTMHWWRSTPKIRTENGVQLHALCKYRPLYHGDRRSITEGIIFGLACLKLLRVKFDVLDVDHMPFFPILGSWVVCKLRGRKLFGTWHEALSRREWTRYMGPAGIVASFIEHISIRLPHTITAASAHTKAQLATIHGRAERVELVASGIDTDLINRVEPANSPFDILYVGRLVKDKNVRVLIRAVQAMAGKDPNVRCAIVGEGIEEPYLKRLALQLKLQNNITFFEPLVKATDVYALMKASKVFCIPSSREGFSLVTLEALGCGTPVVTVDVPTNAARFLVQDKVSGSVVACTPEALASAMSHWISLPQKPDVASRVVDYDWHGLAQKQAEVYTSWAQ
jgi:glycosyltransferase involved in cell wall biosynthesis